MGNSFSSMAVILRHPLTLTLLLSTIPLSHSWSLFRKKPPSSSSSSSKSLAEATKDLLNSSLKDNEGGAGLPTPPSSYFNYESTTMSNNNLLPQIPQFITQTFPLFLKTLFLYKPPVGMTSVYFFFNLLLSRKNKQLVFSLLMNEEEEQRQMERFTKMRKNRIGRSLELDEADGRMMIGLGGVEAVRTELCLAAIEDYIIVSHQANPNDKDDNVNDIDQNKSTNKSDSDSGRPVDLHNLNDPMTLSYYATAARDALKVNSAPMTSREDFVQRTIEPLVRLDQLHDVYVGTSSSSSAQSSSYPGTALRRCLNSNSSSGSSSLDTTNMDEAADIVWMASKVAEVRTIDALLRTLRDRLLLSAVRLSRKEKYRVWRLQWYEVGIGRYFKKWMRRTMKNKTVADDRRNLQLTRAALKREMERLGQVEQLLLSRPCELSETRLLTSVQATVDEIVDNQTTTLPTSIYDVPSVGHIDGAGARLALLRSECDLPGDTTTARNTATTSSAYKGRKNNISETNPVQEWSEEAHTWTMTSRAIICDLVKETISDVFKPTSSLTRDRKSNVETDLNILLQWSKRYKSDIEGWDTVLVLVDNLSKARLMREHKYLPTAIDLKYWFKRVDIFGIPSSLATICGALIIHNTVKPYWPEIVTGTKVVAETAWGVIEFRFVNPLKDIALDLLNRRPKLLDPFALSNEETSLDNMLLDIGLGDGTKEGRRDALAAASRMYETELAQGAIRNVFRGEMVRLILIQVQQLKTGSLQAMGTIDDLMDSNRLNVQLLATIPAILLVTFGTRIFFRAMYSLRSRDIVGLPSAHAEMKDLLTKMERCLLLSSPVADNGDFLTADSGRKYDYSSIGRGAFLRPNELGEFVLYMHSYLVILDYCSPPFPSKACDAIHSGMQDLLMQGQLSTKRQIALLQLIGAKHDDLLKSI